MNHIPTCTNQLYTCDHCTFRAVATSRGPYVLNNGAGRDLHLAAIVSAQAEQREWIARRLARLRNIGDNTPLPRTDGRHVFPCEEVKTGHCVCAHQDGYRLSLQQAQRLERCVVGEFEG